MSGENEDGVEARAVGDGWEGERAGYNQANTYERGMPTSWLYTHPQSASIPALVSHSKSPHSPVLPLTFCNTHLPVLRPPHHRVINIMVAKKSADGAQSCRGGDSGRVGMWWEHEERVGETRLKPPRCCATRRAASTKSGSPSETFISNIIYRVKPIMCTGRRYCLGSICMPGTRRSMTSMVQEFHGKQGGVQVSILLEHDSSCWWRRHAYATDDASGIAKCRAWWRS